jgi:hypothetical protein
MFPRIGVEALDGTFVACHVKWKSYFYIASYNNFWFTVNLTLLLKTVSKMIAEMKRLEIW